MARATFVKAARKAYPEHDIRKGESYWWWKFAYGSKIFSKTRPRPAQLTQSEYFGELYGIQEDIDALEASDADELRSNVEEIAQRLRDLGELCEEKKSNMPDSLQESDTGQLLEERAEQCSSAADEMDSIDFDYDEEEDGPLDEWIQSKIEEVGGISLE